jgi:phosphate starvation-inducible PhoH-like protein
MNHICKIRHEYIQSSPFFKDSIFAAKRRKGIEDLVVDGLIDSTKKILAFEESITNPRKQIKSFQPKTENQKAFVELMRNDKVDIIIAIGPAGTGKTMLACYAAVEALRLGKVNKIVVTRPVVSVDEEIGFLPGGLESKMDPWTRPIFDTLRETYSAKEIDRMVEEGVIEIVPLGFMRGRTFKNAWIIADEMQNSTPMQMFMLATRIGEDSKMIITGDLNQSDRNANDNGLLEIYKKVKNAEKNTGLDCVRYIELDKEDVQRSRAAKIILNIYESRKDYESLSSPNNENDLVPIESTPLPEITDVVCANEEQPCDIEWVDITNKEQPSNKRYPTDNDNDAALIPLRHMRNFNSF